MGDQAAAARRRLSLVPEELRVKRTKKVLAQAPTGRSWCAGCQSWRDVVDFGKKATQCRACVSAAQHDARVAKVYGLTPAEYDELLKLQGGKCAICRARPRSKRLAVDHDHATGAVLGLLCSRCNHDLKGAAWDSAAMALALWHYMNTPPTSGAWRAPELGLAAPDVGTRGAQRPPTASADDLGLVTVGVGKGREKGQGASESGNSGEGAHAPRAAAVAILAGLELDVPTAHALWGALDAHLKTVDPAPF